MIVIEVSDCVVAILWNGGSVTKESLRCGHMEVWERTDKMRGTSSTLEFHKDKKKQNICNERLKVVFYHYLKLCEPISF